MTRFSKLLKLRHPRVYVLLAILSGVFNAFSIAPDNFILHSVVISSVDHVLRCLAYMLSAYWIGVLLTSAYGRFLGRLIDSKFTRFTFDSIKTQMWAFLTGAVTPLARVCCDRRSLNFPVEAVPKLAKLRT